MRVSANRQTVSTTARWNMVQSRPDSPGAQKKPLLNRQTGKGSNIKQLQRSLAAAELHLSQTSDPRTVQNMLHGITLLKAQIAGLTGVDQSHFDVYSVKEGSTGYQFAGFVEGGDFDSVAIAQAGVDQSIISPTAQYALLGTLRQKITKVSPPQNATPGGSLKGTIDPASRSNVIRTPSNPKGSTFPTGVPGSTVGFHPTADTRDVEHASGKWYMQGFTPGTHTLATQKGRGVITAPQPGRGKHGQYYGGYVYQPEPGTGDATQ